MDDVLYHVTYSGRLESIADRGLRSGQARSIGSAGYDGHAKRGIFLTDADGVFFWHSKAEEFADYHSENVLEDELVPVVLRVDLDGVEGELEDDELGSKDAGYRDAYIAKGSIAPEFLEVFDGREWLPIEEWDQVNPSLAVVVEIEVEEDDDGEEEQWTSVRFKDCSPLLAPELDPRR